jgi:hypothetical protein
LSLTDILSQSDIGQPEREIKYNLSRARFSTFLNPDFPEEWLPYLSNFTQKAPWTFYDHELIKKIIDFLESDIERSAKAVEAWDNELSIVFNDFFNTSKVAKSDYSLNSMGPKDNVIISNEVHPEYLWLCEHIFGNLVCVYWGVNRKKSHSVKAKFDLGNGERDLKNSQRDFLYFGFNDRVRNGIAHGEVHFRGDGIVYGKKDVAHEYKIDASELLDSLDQLRRTSNNLAIALVLFLGRNKKELEKKSLFYLPSGLSNSIFTSFASREGFEIVGLVDSKLALVGNQLQIFIKSMHRKRDILIYECLRIAKNLNEFTLKDYDRYFYEIDTKDSVTSSLAVDVSKFNRCLENDNISGIPEAIETSLLWADEGKWVARLKSTSYIFKHHFILGLSTINKNLSFNKYPFIIRHSEVISTEFDHRLKLKIIIDQQYNNDQIHAICTKLVNKYRYLPLFKNGDRILKKKLSLRSPSYIWITAYYKDGPLRWLTKRGWLSGNIAFSAEWMVKSTLDPIYVKDHESITDNIRYQFKINESTYREALKI